MTFRALVDWLVRVEGWAGSLSSIESSSYSSFSKSSSLWSRPFADYDERLVPRFNSSSAGLLPLFDVLTSIRSFGAPLFRQFSKDNVSESSIALFHYPSSSFGESGNDCAVVAQLFEESEEGCGCCAFGGQLFEKSEEDCGCCAVGGQLFEESEKDCGCCAVGGRLLEEFAFFLL